MQTTTVATSPAPKYVVHDKPVEQLIDEAVAILERVGWVQNTLVTFRGEVCAIGALAAAMVESTNPEIIFHAAFDNPVVRKRIEEIYGPFSWTTLSTYNDNPTSSKEDVIRMLRRPVAYSTAASSLTSRGFGRRSSDRTAALRLP